MMAALCLCVAPHLLAAQAPAELVPGEEFTAGANLMQKNVKAQGAVFVPDEARPVRAVIVLVEAWPGADRGVYDTSGRKLGESDVPPRLARPGGAPPPAEPDLAVGRFRDQVWRRLSQTCRCALLHLRLGTVRPEADAGLAANGVVIRNGVSDRVVRTASEGGADALLVILKRLGEDSAHRELKDAPLLFWGWSASATFGTTFAELYPERTVAFARYHGHLRGLSVNMNVLRTIPALLIAGGKDEIAGTEDAETFWKAGRSVAAPWTFAVEPEAPHGNEQSIVSSHALIIPWMAAVLGQRLAHDGRRLQPVTETGGWLGDSRTAQVAPYTTFAASKQVASWLPDEATARGWQTVTSERK
ncbi:MAG TPA: alpha/beta hydrolase [Vicinamibacterales bacterium]|nr:alpha/beta hydrolase [Vicinamibacterales bacterium]